MNAEIVQGQKDPLLGWYAQEHRPIPTARFSKTQEAPAVFSTFLYPFKGEQPHFEAVPLEMDSKVFWASALKTAQEGCEVILAKDNRPRSLKLTSGLAGAIKAEAAGLVIRQSVQSGKITFGAWELSSYGGQAVSFSLPEPAMLVWMVMDGHLLVFNADKTKEARIQVKNPFIRDAALCPGAWMDLSTTEAKAVASPLDGFPRS